MEQAQKYEEWVDFRNPNKLKSQMTTDSYSLDLTYIILLNEINFPMPLVSISLSAYHWPITDISERGGRNPIKDRCERDHLHNTLCHPIASMSPKAENIILVSL